MPRPDYCHPQIVHALEKDGWQVDDKEFRIRTPARLVYIDALASRRVNGHRRQILLAEIKCFPESSSLTTDLYIAIGQYIIYRAVLAEIRDETPLYLVIPQHIYDSNFDSTVIRAVRDNHIKLLIVNLEMEAINQWIE